MLVSERAWSFDIGMVILLDMIPGVFLGMGWMRGRDIPWCYNEYLVGNNNLVFYSCIAQKEMS